MMGSRKTAVMLLVLSMMFVPLAASDITGANVTAGSGETASETNVGSTTTEAGEVTNTNLTVTSVTNKWAGFYGQLDATEVLGDSAGNNFYRWTVNDPSGSLVYAVPGSDSAPDSLSSITNPNTFLGSGFNTGVDSANNTFNSTEAVGSLPSTRAAQTFASGQPDNQFTTGLYNNSGGGNNPVYVAEVNNNRAGFDGNPYDFQLLVGVGESASSKTFDFYAQIS